MTKLQVLEVCILVTCLWGPSGGQRSRGPHHPRSQQADSHKHYRPYRPQGTIQSEKLTQDSSLLHDANHIIEDLGEWSSDATKNMTPEELEFHYFKLHDFDNNTKLDGLEILQAISHTAHDDDETLPDDSESGEEENSQHFHREVDKQDEFQYFVELIDQVLAEDDLDNDGFLSYVEYVIGRQRDEKRRTTSASKTQ